MSPLPPYEKESYPVTRRTHGAWYLSSYTYKFNLRRIQVFLDGLKEKKLFGIKCRSCNTVSFPPRLICGRCLQMPDQWVLCRDTATVATFSATYDKKLDPNQENPMPVIAIRQDGADTTWIGLFKEGVPFEKVYIGMPIRAVFKSDGERNASWGDIDYYEPVEPNPTPEMNKDIDKK